MMRQLGVVTFQNWRCDVVLGRYSNGRLSIQLFDCFSGHPVGRATVNIPEYCLEEREVIIKDYAENEGMLEALVEAGIVEPSGRLVTIRCATAHVCRIISWPKVLLI